jgi:hypothetical protein
MQHAYIVSYIVMKPLHCSPVAYREAQLAYGLACFFARNWDDAWIELGLYLERAGRVMQQGRPTPGAVPPPPQAPDTAQQYDAAGSGSGVDDTQTAAEAQPDMGQQGEAPADAMVATDPELLERVELLLEKVRLRLTLR